MAERLVAVVKWGSLQEFVSGICCCNAVVYLLPQGCPFQQPWGNLTYVDKIVLFAGIRCFFGFAPNVNALSFTLLMYWRQ
jgi:hypothetical protein